jgi:glutamate formiminotransferase
VRAYECVPNVSEGRVATTLDACARAIASAGATVAHRTSDTAHHRSVFTFFAERDVALAAALALAAVTTERIDLRAHAGEHPRIGALDVLPFVAFGDAATGDAVSLARDAAERIWERLRVPSYFYGDAATRPERRLLANVRAGGFEALGSRGDAPDVGDAPHPTAGAIAVGVRSPLVAFNVILDSNDLGLARAIARRMRERDGGLRTLRALGIAQADGRVQVSFNVTDPSATPLHTIVAIVRTLAAHAGVTVRGSELIGLVSRRALADVAAAAFAAEGPPREGQNSEG